MEKYLYTYDEFLKDVESLHQTIKPKKHDTLIAVARGGLTLGHFLSSKLDNRNLFTINSISYDHTEQLETCNIFNIPNIENSKKVLIIDDIVDSGQTLNEILNILEKKYPKILFETLSIYSKPTALLQPTYSLKTANSWIEFFWEVV